MEEQKKLIKHTDLLYVAVFEGFLLYWFRNSIDLAVYAVSMLPVIPLVLLYLNRSVRDAIVRRVSGFPINLKHSAMVASIMMISPLVYFNRFSQQAQGYLLLAVNIGLLLSVIINVSKAEQQKG